MRVGIILGAKDLQKVFGGPWWLRLPLQLIGGAVCGAALALLCLALIA
jgi:hypothetical protein